MVFWKLSLVRFASLVFPVPTEILLLFQLAEAKGYLTWFGISMVVSSLIFFGTQQWISWVIDFRDKRLVQSLNQGLYCIALLFSSVSSWYGVHLGSLVSTLIVTNLYFCISFQVYSAMAQGLIKREMAGRYNGVSEIFGQAPTFVGSLIGASIWDRANMPVVMASTALLGLSLIPTVMGLPRIGGLRGAPGPEGGHLMTFFRSDPRRIVTIFLLNAPYIPVYTGNYLRPIYIAQTLSGNPQTLGYSEVVYSMAGILTGSLIPYLLRRSDPFTVALSMGVLCVLIDLLTPLAVYIPLFLLLQTIHGVANPGNRVARKTLVMQTIPVDRIGRFNGSVEVLVVMAKITLLALYTATVGALGPGLLIQLTGILELVLLSFALTVYRSEVSRHGGR